MPASDRDLLRLVALLYDAGTDPSRWTPFFEHYAHVFAADMAFLQRHHLSERRSEILTGTGMSDRFTASYNAHFSRLNVWRDAGRLLYRQGHAIVDQQICARAVLQSPVVKTRSTEVCHVAPPSMLSSTWSSVRVIRGVPSSGSNCVIVGSDVAVTVTVTGEE